MVFKTKQDQVAEILRERIIAGAYARGDKLKQADIAAELGVSITPVREALNVLAAEGYVVSLSHRGLLVPELVPAQVRETYELRLLLEHDLTVQALAHMTPARLAELQQIQHDLALADQHGDRHGARTANYRFHFRLYDGADRPQTIQFVRVLWAKYPFTDQDRVPQRNSQMRAEHDVFLARVQAGDMAGAAAAMLDHIRSGWNQLTASDLLAQAG